VSHPIDDGGFLDSSIAKYEPARRGASMGECAEGANPDTFAEELLGDRSVIHPRFESGRDM
jgi:hypothetical protein